MTTQCSAVSNLVDLPVEFLVEPVTNIPARKMLEVSRSTQGTHGRPSHAIVFKINKTPDLTDNTIVCITYAFDWISVVWLHLILSPFQNRSAAWTWSSPHSQEKCLTVHSTIKMLICFLLKVFLIEAAELIVSYPSNGDFSRRTSKFTRHQAEQIVLEHNKYRRYQVSSKAKLHH